MGSKTVDCRGLACPQPVIKTKTALEEVGIDSVTTIVDNDTARQNVTLFAKNAGYQVSEESKEGFYYLTITSDGNTCGVCGDVLQADAFVGGPVYFITTNELGQGSPDLGVTLIKSFFTTLAAMNTPPAALLFLNAGAYLSCAGTPVQEQLEKLNASGVTILTCGTCLEYYGLKEKLLMGNISNMVEINEWLSGPYKVITIS